MAGRAGHEPARGGGLGVIGGVGRESPSRAVAPVGVGAQHDGAVLAAIGSTTIERPVLSRTCRQIRTDAPAMGLPSGSTTRPPTCVVFLGLMVRAMGRAAAASARTVTSDVLAKPSQAVRLSSARGSTPWSMKARSVGRDGRTAGVPLGPGRLDLDTRDRLAAFIRDRSLDIHAPRQFDRRHRQLVTPARGHGLGHFGRVGRQEEGGKRSASASQTAGSPRGR